MEIPIKDKIVSTEKILAMILKYETALSIGTASETKQVNTKRITYPYEKSVENPIDVVPLKKSNSHLSSVKNFGLSVMCMK